MAGPVKVGRYLLFEPFAAGGTAQVHFGRLLGPAGFSRTFAVKRLHAHLAGNVDFTTMLLDEARLTARIRHPSVVPVFDVLRVAGELLLVMEYFPGVSIARLLSRARRQGVADGVPIPVALALVHDTLAGLQAAHDATNESGQPLEIVHRDVSPQNVLVGTDGLGRVLDFGIAHAAERLQLTRTGEVKGKLEYLAPEQVRAQRVDRRTDVYATSVLLWELLTGERLFRAPARADAGSVSDDLEILRRICRGVDRPPSELRAEVTPELDRVVLRGLSPDAADRFESARAMAAALEDAAERAAPARVAGWMRACAAPVLDQMAARLACVEAYVPDGSEPSADALAPGALDELLDEPASGITARRRPKPPPVATASYTQPPEPARAPPPLASGEVTESMTVPAPPPRAESQPAAPAPPRWSLVGAAVAAATLFGGAFVALALARSCSSADADGVVAEQPPRAPTSASPPPATSPALPAPVPASAPSSKSPRPPRPAPRPSPPRPAPRPAAAPPKPSCNPPYVLDADGVRIPKRECFR